MVKHTYDEVKKAFEDIGCILVSKEYSGKDKILDFYCEKHEDKGIQHLKFKQILNGRKCIFCEKEISAKKFEDKLSDILPNIVIIGEFSGMKNRVKVKCKIHNYEWEPYAYNLSSGFGCPICGREKVTKAKRKPLDVMLRDLKEKQPNAHLISEISSIEKVYSYVTMKCDICGTEWTATVANLTKKKNNTGCPCCSIKRVASHCRKTLDELKKDAEKIGSTVIPIGEYSNTHSPILCKCKIHNNTQFYQIPITILNGSNSCPKCVPYKREKEMLNILEKYHLKYTPQKRFKECKDIKTLPFDAYLEDYNIAIEYDGEGHYIPIPRSKNDDGIKSLKRTQKHDGIKNNFCKNNHMPLIRIPYWEQNNIENFLTNELRKYIKIS